MVSKRTRQLVLSAALMFVGSSTIACAGEYQEPGTQEPTITATENEATEQAGEQPADPNETVATEPTSEETGDLQVEGAEGRDDGFAQMMSENPADAEADTGSDDEIGQQSEALLSTRGASLASEARRIAGYTNRSTSYYSFTSYMNESTGTRRTDCSGLVAYILSRKQPSGYSLVPKYEGSVRPLARDYFNYLKNRPTTASTQSSARWRKIQYARNLKPGDLIVYAYSSGQTTGHVMMVKELPYRGRSYEWIIPVVDSAKSGHANDTRGTTYSGPGTGAIGLKVDSYGKPYGYYWSGGKSTTLNTTPIVMGRLE